MNHRPFNQLKHGTLPRAWWEDRYDDPNTTFRCITCRRTGGFPAGDGRSPAGHAGQPGARESGTGSTRCACSPAGASATNGARAARGCPCCPARCAGSPHGATALRAPGAGRNAALRAATACSPADSIGANDQSKRPATAIPPGTRLTPAERAAGCSGTVQVAGPAKRAVAAASSAQYAPATARRTHIAPDRRPAIAPPARIAARATTGANSAGAPAACAVTPTADAAQCLAGPIKRADFAREPPQWRPAPHSRCRAAGAFCVALCATQWRRQLA